MRKNPAVLLCFLFAFFTLTISFAQTSPTSAQNKATSEQISDDAVKLMRQDVRSQRKQLVAANLPLTDSEATKFWPVYDRYVAEMTKLGDTRYALLKEYAQAYQTMTDEQAASLVKRSLASDEAMTQLRSQWVAEFQKVISAKKTAMFFQIDRRLNLLIDLQLASEIPLVNP